MKRFVKNQAGFTLLELTVSIAVLVILTIVVFANFRFNARGEDLSLALEQLQSDVQAAQIYSLAGRAENGAVPAGGYGLALTTGESTYVLFGDTNSDGVYTAADDDLISNNALAGSAFVQSFEYTTAVAPFTWQPITASQISVTFQPPAVTLVPSQADAKAVRIRLYNPTTQQTRNLTISLVTGAGSGN